MIHKDYIAIAAAFAQQRDVGPCRTDADVIAEQVAHAMHGILASAVGNVLARDNPRFDRAEFLTACGVK